MVDNYGQVEVSPEEIASLSSETTTSQKEVQPQEPPPDKEEVKAETSESDDASANEQEADGFEIDGKTYSEEDILAWMKDSKNKSEWTKSNTHKAQSLARWNKFSKMYGDDQPFKEYILDYFYDDPDTLKKLGFADLDNLDTQGEATEESVDTEVNDPRINSIDERVRTIEVENNMKVLERELDTIVDKNPDFFEDGNSMDFLKFVDENDILDLDAGFKLWSYDKLSDKLAHQKKIEENAKRSTSKVIASETGAKETKTPFVPKDYKDITVESVAKYFK